MYVENILVRPITSRILSLQTLTHYLVVILRQKKKNHISHNSCAPGLHSKSRRRQLAIHIVHIIF